MIYHTKESTIEFNVDVSGVNDTDMLVRFIIETTDMDISFNCKSTNKKDWTCKIPPMKFLEKTTYTYRIEVCTDGYFLKGSIGSITISATAELYNTEPKNITLSPKKDESSEENNLSDVEVKSVPKPVKVEELIPKTTVKKVEKSEEKKQNQIKEYTNNAFWNKTIEMIDKDIIQELYQEIVPEKDVVEPTINKVFDSIIKEAKGFVNTDAEPSTSPSQPTIKSFKFGKSDLKTSQIITEADTGQVMTDKIRKILMSDPEVVQTKKNKKIKITKGNASDN